jgi:trimethylamine--corrinoid protein Co-methyltransferase
MRAGSGRRRRAQDIVQKPWGAIRNPFPPFNLVSDDEVEAIHAAALDILETIGVRCQVKEARDLLRQAGARVDEGEGLVRLGREIVAQALTTVPSSITLVPRNPARAVTLGHDRMTTAAVLGPPNVTDLLRGRRTGTLADLTELLKLTQVFNAVQMNGWPVEPLDIAVRDRHLVAAEAMLTVTDKVPYVFCQSRQRISDVLTMCAMARGETLEQFARRPGVFSIINTNTPLQYDVPMTVGVMDMARYGQPVLLTPFVMAGASTPATIASAMALNTAEVLFGVALGQLVRPGAPVL